MIYVHEKDFGRQIELLKHIAGSAEYSVCAWLYPESKVSSFAGQGVERSDLEPVTEYKDGTIPKHTALTKCSNDLFQLLLEAQSEVVSNCDSLALYRGKSRNWAVVTIGHEGMCLVRDTRLLSQLIVAGFSVSLEEPNWW